MTEAGRFAVYRFAAEVFWKLELVWREKGVVGLGSCEVGVGVLKIESEEEGLVCFFATFDIIETVGGVAFGDVPRAIVF